MIGVAGVLRDGSSAQGPPGAPPPAPAAPPVGASAGALAPTSISPESGEVVVFVLADIERRARLWGWSRIMMGAAALRGVPGLRFAKVMGSGDRGGFDPMKPSASIQALFCVFDDARAADAFTGPSGALRAWQDRSRECLVVGLRPYSCRGSWSGRRLEASASAPAHGPVVSLTRASIRPSKAVAFWRMQPAAARSLADRPGCLLAAGVGEAPVLRQATFSVWSSVAAMDAYARTGAHQDAIRAAAHGAFFSESMFVRFVPHAAQGTWQGRPLAC